MSKFPVTSPETRTTGENTTNATQTAIQQIVTRPGETVTVKCFISARRTGGSSGSSTNGATYELLGSFVNDAGTLYQVGSTSKIASEVDTSWDADFDISDNKNIKPSGTGKANVNIKWICHSIIIRAK